MFLHHDSSWVFYVIILVIKYNYFQIRVKFLNTSAKSFFLWWIICVQLVINKIDNILIKKSVTQLAPSSNLFVALQYTVPSIRIFERDKRNIRVKPNLLQVPQ